MADLAELQRQLIDATSQLVDAADARRAADRDYDDANQVLDGAREARMKHDTEETRRAVQDAQTELNRSIHAKNDATDALEKKLRAYLEAQAKFLAELMRR